ncbi:MAG: glucose-6-phosphate dehydrogenase [Planctomycetes bacterium]|nr:glucose-6-phosphate dehydrogenase [Planctomycetota bacterium]
MDKPHPPGPTALVIFGAGGDLTKRKLLPAIYNLSLDHWLPEHFAVLGVDRTPMDDDAFRQHLREGVDQFSRRGKTKDQEWQSFAPRLSYLAADLTKAKTYSEVADWLSRQEGAKQEDANQVFYLAVPPTLVEAITTQLGKAGLAKNRQHARVVVEKPFGRDLESARALNRHLTEIFDESQIYRIDHYLGKETVQNILAFRFANSLYEPIWDRRYINQVQITVAEEVGVEHRGGYYDQAGALRDMVQNHLLQVLCLIAMEPPVSFSADEIRDRKVDVLRAIRPIPADEVEHWAVRGQYGPGEIQGAKVPGYRQEPGVSSSSTTETFAALRLLVDNWRWQDVPFFLRTGKRLPSRVSEAAIQFRPVPHRSFPASAVERWQPNCLVLRIQPAEGILLRFQVKDPGPTFLLRPADMHFMYQEEIAKPVPEAYETLLLDVMRGDATLFMRADQVEAAWAVVMPVLEGWARQSAPRYPNYPAGSWGPEGANALLAKEGRTWLVPSIVNQEAGS